MAIKPLNIRTMPEKLHHEIKVLAAQKGKSMQALAIELLEDGVKKQQEA